MFKKARAGLIPALIVSSVLIVAFIAPVGASRIAAGTACTYPFGPFTSATLTPSPADPQKEGTTVTLNASSTGCTAPEYKFFLQSPGGSWRAVSGYGGPSYVWNTSGAKEGFWGIGVWVRQIGSTAAYQVYFLGTYKILAYCTDADITATPTHPVPRGTPVTLTGSSTGCPFPRYRFWIWNNGHWSSFGPYSASNTVVWNTTGYSKGAHRIGVWVRNRNSHRSYDAYDIITYYLT
jgi:hypothetical protein